MRIQHNIAALNSHRQLTGNNNSVSKNLEKLSSGYRINRAGDDAAGLAISEKMRAQITSLNTASKNSQDGISLVQTAEGALTEVHSMLNRMTELANQAANGTLQDDDRSRAMTEVDALRSEINRISESTNFNGITLLDGSMGGAQDTASVTIAGYTITGLDASIGKVELKASGAGTKASADSFKIVDGVLEITGQTKGAGAELTAADFQTALQNAGYKNAKVTGASGVFAATAATATTKVAASSGKMAASTQGTGFEIKFDKGDYSGTTTSVAITGVANTAAVGNVRTGKALVMTLDNTKEYTASDINKMLKDSGAGEMTVSFEGKQLGSAVVTGLGIDTAVKGAITAGAGVAGGGGLDLQIGESSNDFDRLSVNVKSTDTTALGIDAIDIGTQEGARAAVDKIKAAINTVSSTRGDLGAIQNRLEHTINNLGVTAENMTAAESRIRDVDMAQEMMNFTKNNILTQASQAMLAQANQLPQGVLQLLQ